MAEDKLQQQRLELKYRITEAAALRVRDFVSAYLQIDEFGATRPNLSYPVHSLYLDSDDLRLYWDTINGTKNRFKLRLRFYDNRPEAPVYFEIKRRMNNCIMKQRGGVRRDAVDWLLAGHIPEPAHLTSDNPKSLVALQRFCERMTRMHAQPKAHIAYLREAWVSTSDNSVRVTLDREVKCEPEFTARLNTELTQPVFAFHPDVILELKFTVKGQKHSLWDIGDSIDLDLHSNQNYPPWFENLVRVFSLMQCGAAKYVEGIAMAGEHWFQNPNHSAQFAPYAQSLVADRAAGEDYD